MCDYSLEAVKSRKAAVGDRLTIKKFGHGTSGFMEAGSNVIEPDAVCLLPGTELAFDAPVKVIAHYVTATTPNANGGFNAAYSGPKEIEHKVARFAKIDENQAFRHHDGLEFPDRLGVAPVLLTNLEEGQTATVLQMPVEVVAELAPMGEVDQSDRPQAVQAPVYY